jgi:IclR family transcriptional regulator, KDG regulon repressor
VEEGGRQLRTVTNALRLLRLLAEPPAARTVTALGRELGMGKSMVHSLLATMLRQGFVERLPDHTYRLGLGVLLVGEAARRMRDVRTVALPELRRLCEAVDEPVYLFARHGDQGILLERLVPNTRALVTMEAGEYGPLHAGSLRKVLLAYAGDDEIERYLAAGPLERFTPWTTVEPATLRAQLAAIRQAGFAYTEQEGYEGMAGLAAPVFDAFGCVGASVGVSTVMSRLRERRWEAAALVCAAAARISAALGYAGQTATY